jgi:hypothetical protein
MRRFSSVAATGVVAVALLASTVAPAWSQTPAAGQAAPAAGGTKREACKMDAKSQTGAKQDKIDDYQVCLVQARLDCLKEAIAKKIVGSARKDYVKTCIGPRADDAN